MLSTDNHRYHLNNRIHDHHGSDGLRLVRATKRMLTAVHVEAIILSSTCDAEIKTCIESPA